MVILDTDICISILNGSLELSQISNFLTEEIFITPITVRELFFTANKSSSPAENKAVIEKFLLTVQILQADISIWKFIADITWKLNKEEKEYALDNVFIYCASKVYKAKLITLNSKRYCFT
jgi:predicted nucleic acid-binding protein